MSTDRGGYPDFEGTRLAEILDSRAESPAIPGVTRWRKRGVIEAVQLTDDADWEAIAAWCGATLRNREMGDSGEYETLITIPAAFPEGTLEAAEGWWIVRLGDADLLMYPPDDFAATYEPAPGPLIMPADEFAALRTVAEAAGMASLSPASPVPSAEALERAEARLAAIAAHCRARMKGPGRSGISLSAASFILGIAEGSDEEEARDA